MNKNIILSFLLINLSSAWSQDLSPQYVALAQKIYADMHYEYEICMKIADNRENLALKKSYNAMDIGAMAEKVDNLGTKESLGYPLSVGEVFDQDAIIVSTLKEDTQACKKHLPSVEKMANEIEKQSLLKKIPKFVK